MTPFAILSIIGLFLSSMVLIYRYVKNHPELLQE